MDHCFYIAKTDRKARLQELFARRFLGTFERSKVPGENVLLAYISDITFKGDFLSFPTQRIGELNHS